MPPRHDKNQGLAQYPDGAWGVDCYLADGRRYRKKCGTITQARAHLTEIRAQKQRGELPAPKPEARKRMAYYLERFLETCTNRDSRRYAARWLAICGEAYPEDIDAHQIKLFVKSGLAKQLKPATIVRQLSALQAAFSEAERCGLPKASNPFSDRKALGIPKVNNAKTRCLSREEEARLLDALGEHASMAEFAVLTGMRWGNQIDMQWCDVDFDQRTAVLPITKSGRSQVIYLSQRAAQLLQEQKAKGHPRLVWPSPEGKRLVYSNFRSRFWLPAVRAAGLEDVTWHILRHTTASRLVEAGESLYMVQSVLGHSDPRVSLRYSHLGGHDIRRAMEVLDAKKDGQGRP